MALQTDTSQAVADRQSVLTFTSKNDGDEASTWAVGPEKEIPLKLHLRVPALITDCSLGFGLFFFKTTLSFSHGHHVTRETQETTQRSWTICRFWEWRLGLCIIYKSETSKKTVLSTLECSSSSCPFHLTVNPDPHVSDIQNKNQTDFKYRYFL